MQCPHDIYVSLFQTSVCNVGCSLLCTVPYCYVFVELIIVDDIVRGVRKSPLDC